MWKGIHSFHNIFTALGLISCLLPLCVIPPAPTQNTKQRDCTLLRGFWTDDGLYSGLGDATQGQCFCGVLSNSPLASALGAPSNARKHLFLAERWLKYPPSWILVSPRSNVSE